MRTAGHTGLFLGSVLALSIAAYRGLSLPVVLPALRASSGRGGVGRGHKLAAHCMELLPRRTFIPNPEGGAVGRYLRQLLGGAWTRIDARYVPLGANPF